jgi:nucleotide-binding universal stress UspA family protein
MPERSEGMSVVVGYVPDETGYLAVQQATREAGWRDTELVIVNVVDQAGYTRPTAADEQQLDAVEAYLRERGARYSIRHVTPDAGPASDAILEIARETDAQLIVIGLKRRSAVAKAVLGSNAQRVLGGAPCPVLAVRAAED